jgi:hypothetical protein
MFTYELFKICLEKYIVLCYTVNNEEEQLDAAETEDII